MKVESCAFRSNLYIKLYAQYHRKREPEMNENNYSDCNKNSPKDIIQLMDELWSILIFWALIGVVIFIKTKPRKQE